MKTLTASAAYGYHELRLFYQRNMTIAMMVAIMLQMMVIGGFHLAEWLKPSKMSVNIIKIPGGMLLPPPSIHEQLPSIGASILPAKFAVGLPVPIPDCDANPDIKYAGQKDLSNEADKQWENLGDGPIQMDGSITPADDIEPSPEAWISIERYPQMVMNSVPEYPDIARRIGLEGSVFVKVLLDKEGKVKKALLVKTSDEIFAQAALNAAKKWVFTPALMNGKPVQVWVAIPFRFRLATK